MSKFLPNCKFTCSWQPGTERKACIKVFSCYQGLAM